NPLDHLFWAHPSDQPAPQRPVGPPAPLVDQGRPPAPLVDQGRPPASLVDQGDLLRRGRSRKATCAPDSGPPETDQVTRGGVHAEGRPPAPLIQPPAPLETDQVTRGGVHAETSAHAIRVGSTLLSAMVVPPPELAHSRPVFEDALFSAPHGLPHETHGTKEDVPDACPTFRQVWGPGAASTRRKRVDLCDFEVPAVEGLRSAEDEYVVVMCRPQDRVVATQHSMELRGTA
ncbi:hypothetical protein JTE90_006021, partial [Oedothorax gibbosus]